MFDIGMVELLVIGIVALIVIGPKDLPGLFHNIGRFTARARSMAREFSRAMEDAAKESGVDGVAKDLRNVTNPRKMGMDKLSEAAKSFEDWDPINPKPKPERGPATQALTEERAEAVRKIRENTVKVAEDRIAKEKAAAEADAAPAKATAAKKPAAKKPAAKKPAAKAKTSAKSAGATKTTTSKPAAKKATAKSGTPKKTTAKASTAKTAAPKAATSKSTKSTGTSGT